MESGPSGSSQKRGKTQRSVIIVPTRQSPDRGGRGKLFECILSNRITSHLEETEGLSDLQYVFCSGKLTVNAIKQARNLIIEKIEVEGVSIAINFDIANAFNSLPWKKILEALRAKGLPNYLRKIASSYFEERSLTYIDDQAQVKRGSISCRVPQDLVLGPLFRILGTMLF